MCSKIGVAASTANHKGEQAEGGPLCWASLDLSLAASFLQRSELEANQRNVFIVSDTDKTINSGGFTETDGTNASEDQDKEKLLHPHQHSIPGNFQQYPVNLIVLVRQRWRSARDQYRREFNPIPSTSANTRKRKYVYFDNLDLLRPIMEVTDSELSLTPPDEAVPVTQNRAASSMEEPKPEATPEQTKKAKPEPQNETFILKVRGRKRFKIFHHLNEALEAEDKIIRVFPEKFTSFCRLTIPAFDRLLAIVHSDLCYADTRMRRSVSAEERLLITLRFLATGESYTSLHLQFRVGKSTISEIVRCTCGVIWQKLQPMVMPSPTEETWLQVAAGFQTVANFPNCIGAVDGKHVRVQKPPRSGSLFFNYKKYFSVVLMAVADAHYKFIAIDVGAYGSTGDSRVLRTSQIGLQVLQDCVTLPAPQPLLGFTDPLPFVMVSDEAFPLLPNLLRPYPRRGLDTRRRIFNYRLSRARRYVECTFGILTSQWRILHTTIQLETETVDTVIKACCVLHNYAREYSSQQVEETQQAEFNPVFNVSSGRPTNSGVLVRESFTDYFMSPEGAVHWQYSCVGDVQPDQQTPMGQG
ncbi:uncharacterized protein ACNLHF_006145 [Anomaloglossus baeobatrachus]